MLGVGAYPREPETSVLGLAVGDEIRLSEKDFAALERRFA